MSCSIIGNRDIKYRTIRWEIIDSCNYQCIYCSQHSPNKKYNIYGDFHETIYKINKLNLSNSVLKLYGGEPTLHPNFFEICDMIKMPFGLYTNLSKPIDFWKKLICYENLVDINIAYHRKFTDIDTFLQKLLTIVNEKHVYVNVLLENDDCENNIEDFLTIQSSMLQFDVRTTLSKIVGVENYYNSIDLNIHKKHLNQYQHIDFIRNNYRRSVNEYDFTIDNINTKNYICDMRKYFLSLNMDGNFYNFCLNGKPICSIKDNIDALREALLPKNIICTYDTACLMHYLMIGKKIKI